MLPIAGRLIDWLGTRIGYAAAVAVWTCAAMSHSLARNAWQFAVARFALGIGEAANFPAAIKTVANWFPARERALATGIFNSGSNIGALIAPLFVPFIAAHFGWRYSFIATGSLDILWIVLWLLIYRLPREHPRITAAELALIEADQPVTEPKIPYRDLLRKPAAWAFIVGKFCTDPIWWFYLFWLPGFLNQKYGLDLVHLGLPLVAVYLGADVGSIGGGWLSSYLIRRGFTPTGARRTALAVCALGPLPVMTLMWVHSNLWLTVALVALAASAHQGWSANLYTLVSDSFPRSSVASLTGLGGMAGATTGLIAAPLIAYWLDFSHDRYGPLFLIASSMYVLTFLVINWLLLRHVRMRPA
jgi:ACS family hexuronate transporter-like MFS transporter